MKQEKEIYITPQIVVMQVEVENGYQTSELEADVEGAIWLDDEDFGEVVVF